MSIYLSAAVNFDQTILIKYMHKQVGKDGCAFPDLGYNGLKINTARDNLK